MCQDLELMDGECGGDDSDDGDGDEYDDDDDDLFMRRRRLSLYMVHASVPSRAVLGTNGRACPSSPHIQLLAAG